MIVSVYPPLESGLVLKRGRGPSVFPFSEPNCHLTHLGRGAVWLGLKAIGVPKRLAMPAFHCGSEVEAARVLGIEIEFYRVDSNLVVDEEHMEDVASRCDALYLISNFGFPTAYDAAARTGATIIEDVAHGLFSSDKGGRALGSGADVAVFCPRKSLGAPDGGALLANGAIDQPGDRASSWKATTSLILNSGAQAGFAPVAALAGAILRRVSATERAAEAGTMTETVIGQWNLTESDLSYAASRPARLTEVVVSRCDAGRIRTRRRENFEIVRDRVRDHMPPPYRELPNGTCPLYVPVSVPRRDAALKRLWGRGVRAIEIWPVAHPLLEGYDDLGRLRSRLIALPVHQGLSTEIADHIGRVAEEVIRSEAE